MSRPPSAAIPLVFGVACLVAALYSVAGYVMVASFSTSNPGYPGHARAGTIWATAAVIAGILAIACMVAAVRRIRAARPTR
jgi:hypothetical protein